MEFLTSLDPFGLWQLWLIVALLVLVFDLVVLGGLMSGGGGITLIVAGGAFGAAVAAALGAGLSGQVLGGVAGMIVAAGLVFWIGRYWVRGGDDNLHTQDVRAPRQVLVVELRGERLGVSLLGDFYPARSASGDGLLQVGERVRIQRFEGVTAVVTPISEE